MRFSSYFFNVLLLPFTKVWSQINQLQKDSLEKKFWKGIGLRVCNFYSEMVKNRTRRKKVDFWAIGLGQDQQQ